MKNILLTGATGYIGSHVLEMLLEHETYSVSIIVRPTSDLKYINHFKNRINIYEYTGFDSLNNIFQIGGFDLVIHLAGYVGSGMSYEEVDKNIKGNLLLASHLLEAMRLNGVSKIINTGSYWEFGDLNRKVPKTIYAIYKTSVRNIIAQYVESYSFKVINLILYDVYGEDDDRRKIIPILLGLKEDESISMTPGFQKLNFVHIQDVVEGYKISLNALIENCKIYINKTYHLCGDEFITLRDLVKKIESASQRKLNVDWGAKGYNIFQIMQPSLKGSRLPDWKPNITIDQGLNYFVDPSE